MAVLDYVHFHDVCNEKLEKYHKMLYYYYFIYFWKTYGKYNNVLM
jgi:hypothetical protein